MHTALNMSTTLSRMRGIRFSCALGAVFGIIAAPEFDRAPLSDGILMPPARRSTRQFRVLIEFQPNMALVAFVLGLLTAVAATLLTGIRAARMPIAEALRAL